MAFCQGMNWFLTHKVTPFCKFKKGTFSWVSSPTMDAVGHERRTSSAQCCELPGPLEKPECLVDCLGEWFQITESDLREVEKRRFVLSRSLPECSVQTPP